MTILDDVLAGLRTDLASLDTASRDRPAKQSKVYDDLREKQDVQRAKRLVTARQNAVKSVNELLERKRKEMSADSVPTEDREHNSARTVHGE